MLLLMDIRGEALRWECEGLSTTGKGHSNSAIYGIQYEVSDPLEVVHFTTRAKMSEMMELLKRQHCSFTGLQYLGLLL